MLLSHGVEEVAREAVHGDLENGLRGRAVRVLAQTLHIRLGAGEEKYVEAAVQKAELVFKFNWKRGGVVAYLEYRESSFPEMPDHVRRERGADLVDKINESFWDVEVGVPIEPPPVVVGEDLMTREEVVALAVPKIGEMTTLISALGPLTDEERRQVLPLALDTVAELAKLLPPGTTEGEAFKAVLGQRGAAEAKVDAPDEAAPTIGTDSDRDALRKAA